MEFLDIKEIGSGGMGKVYSARSPVDGRRVILKTLHPLLSQDAVYQTRLKKEGEILGRLSHPNIVSFIGYKTVEIETQRTEVSKRGRLHPALPMEGATRAPMIETQRTEVSERGRLHPALPVEGATRAPMIETREETCLIMEYIDGMNLQEKMDQKGSMTYEEVVPFFLQICEALGYLHQNQIFHLDLKPENILLSREGRLFLTDFGIASVQISLEKTVPMINPIGSLSYASPEQIKGERCDGRSDLYSLGMILYALLNGKNYFFGAEKRRVWGELVYDQKPFQMTFPKEVPLSFQNMIRKLSEKKKEERYSDIKALLREFHRQMTKPGSLPNPEISSSLPSPSKVKGLFSEKGIILAAGIVVVLFSFFYGAIPAPPVATPDPRPVGGNESPVVPLAASIPSTGTQQAEPVIQLVSSTRQNGTEPVEKERVSKTLSDSELEKFLLDFKSNIENKDLGSLKEEILISPDNLSYFHRLFHEISSPEVRIRQVNQEGSTIKVQYEMIPPLLSSPVSKGFLSFRDGVWRHSLSTPLDIAE